MPRVSTVIFENVAVAAAQDFLELRPGTNHPCAVLGFTIDQRTDVGDAKEEFLRWEIIRGYTTSGSGGTVPSGVNLSSGDAAPNYTAEVNNTTQASAGTPVVLWAGAFNTRTGLAIFFPPEMTPFVSAADTILVIRLLAAPSQSLNMSGTFVIAED